MILALFYWPFFFFNDPSPNGSAFYPAISKRRTYLSFLSRPTPPHPQIQQFPSVSVNPPKSPSFQQTFFSSKVAPCRPLPFSDDGPRFLPRYIFVSLSVPRAALGLASMSSLPPRPCFTTSSPWVTSPIYRRLNFPTYQVMGIASHSLSIMKSPPSSFFWCLSSLRAFFFPSSLP